jgi:hypothetical protein
VLPLPVRPQRRGGRGAVRTAQPELRLPRAEGDPAQGDGVVALQLQERVEGEVGVRRLVVAGPAVK